MLTTKRLHSDLLDAGLLGGAWVHGCACMPQLVGVRARAGTLHSRGMPFVGAAARPPATPTAWMWARLASTARPPSGAVITTSHCHSVIPRSASPGAVLKAWLELMPDGTLPNARIRESVLRLLGQVGWGGALSGCVRAE